MTSAKTWIFKTVRLLSLVFAFTALSGEALTARAPYATVTNPDSNPTGVRRIIATSDGGAYFLVHDLNTTRVIRYGPGGNVLWFKDLPARYAALAEKDSSDGLVVAYQAGESVWAISLKDSAAPNPFQLTMRGHLRAVAAGDQRGGVVYSENASLVLAHFSNQHHDLRRTTLATGGQFVGLTRGTNGFFAVVQFGEQNMVSYVANSNFRRDVMVQSQLKPLVASGPDNAIYVLEQRNYFSQPIRLTKITNTGEVSQIVAKGPVFDARSFEFVGDGSIIVRFGNKLKWFDLEKDVLRLELSIYDGTPIQPTENGLVYLERYFVGGAYSVHALQYDYRAKRIVKRYAVPQDVTQPEAFAEDLALGVNGKVFVGYSKGAGLDFRAALATFDSTGPIIDNVVVSSVSHASASLLDAAHDAQGNVYLLYSGLNAARLVKVEPDGNASVFKTYKHKLKPGYSAFELALTFVGGRVAVENGQVRVALSAKRYFGYTMFIDSFDVHGSVLSNYVNEDYWQGWWLFGCDEKLSTLTLMAGVRTMSDGHFYAREGLTMYSSIPDARNGLIANGKVYQGQGYYQNMLVRANAGRGLWMRPIEAESPMIVSGESVFRVNIENLGGNARRYRFEKRRLDTGALVKLSDYAWDTQPGSLLEHNGIVYHHVAYENQSRVVAINDELEVLWQAGFDQSITSPVLLGDKIAVSSGNKIQVLNGTDGSFIAEHDAPPSWFALIPGEGQHLMTARTSESGIELTGYPLSSGNWSVQLPSLFSESMVDGKIEFANVLPGDATVYLKAETTAITLPEKVVVKRGTRSATFPIAVARIPTNCVRYITATLNGQTQRYRVEIRLAELGGVRLNRTSTIGGSTIEAEVWLWGPAPATGFSVSVTGTSKLSVPNAVVIPAGATSVKFNLQTQAVTTPSEQVVTVSAGRKSYTARVVLVPRS